MLCRLSYSGDGSRQRSALAEIRSAAPYAGLTDTIWRTVLEYIATGGYALRAYDKFRRLVEDSPGHWRITRPQAPPDMWCTIISASDPSATPSQMQPTATSRSAGRSCG